MRTGIAEGTCLVVLNRHKHLAHAEPSWSINGDKADELHLQKGIAKPTVCEPKGALEVRQFAVFVQDSTHTPGLIEALIYKWRA
jgi:hypothetical protein